ncbi:MAG: hypothetical protein JXR51_01175 [Bacteroidales bacterium]|nr:hypothetical protein [Bacteroidales bacterium]MBN2755755.1 hypothetical protein [Bacteroidales bacterium]
MKKVNLISLISVSLLMLFFNISLVSQTLDSYGTLERPKDIGNSDFDGFKNNSFDTYFNTCKIEANLKEIEGNVEKYNADKENIDANALKSDLKSLTDINTSINGLREDLKTLKDKSENMASKAKTLTPKTKSLKAVQNTKKSTEAINQAKSKMPVIAQTNAELIKSVKGLLGEN